MMGWALLNEAKELSMELTMSMFATQADYWKARAELAETTVRKTAGALGCVPDNEAMLSKVDELRNALAVVVRERHNPEFTGVARRPRAT
jgi:hypothetical protein